MTNSLYKRLGGEPALEAAVGMFYVKVLKDPILKPMFEGVDMDSLKRHQQAFMGYAFGGPNEYDGRSMCAAHAHLVERFGLNDVHFDAVAEHLESTLKALKVDNTTVMEVLVLVESLRKDVLGKDVA